MLQQLWYECEWGGFLLSAEGDYLVGLKFAAQCPDNLAPASSLLHEAAAQLEAYFAGTRRGFDLPLRPKGTDFQLATWAQLQAIPYGETRSYGQLASLLGNPKAARAVGMANNRNPIGIIIPCHRVIGASGKLVGYAGGLALKERLLALESAQGLL